MTSKPQNPALRTFRSPHDDWARTLRLNERENVVSIFLMVLERDEFAARSCGEASMDVAAAVAAVFEKIEGAVSRGT